ncbi:30S ribosomal protein S13 [Candidatus Shapirobacteria bacterium CG03_land_8_20_14_0_80_40_19]|uniref:Small ribosomal subunit protein uS13 n=4 Tax=Candidatus Shapironibacteriota TaxID=1752721 RepID=A0A2M7BE09_9BACT|nr:MAG: 30S ribosomal protein S13 [Candidatus Shapirobacteria bacterium CG11_big_fil_rev_8_21_14_0_20_40_12]PIV01337.1 MAG: 30S ribosomal protein S13 [Candidatus Shapirobacteria bacterium CG03_land_8_20_14_0_80_40_19]PJC29213.1 MAG: 30S ribosomal protein S13 [Candidatus Shapirobacteria bacterium CG_4_9_14_0_2_um_filter_40_11]PJC76672.1 MAG: 30S ribosomal protein S13 [Candidatus Shapirobacteria bacterium CG_4_8_14_3_um_filter_39_11]
MPRIIGINLPEAKRIDIALTHIFGVGRKNVVRILSEAKVDGAKKAGSLSDEETTRLQKSIEGNTKVEGDLRREIQENVKRLKQIGSYRGRRHIANLPVRGQRTRSNARTKRGKRVTIGALKKDDLAKKQQPEPIKTKSA